VDIALPNGQRFRKNVKSKKQADDLHQKITSEIFEGKWDIQEREMILFRQLVSQYLEYCAVNKATSTYKCDKYRIEAHLLPYFGDMQLTQITPQIVEAYKSMRVNNKAAPKTINHELSNLQHMMKLAQRWGYIRDNVVATVPKLRLVKNPPRFLSHEEVEKLINAAGGSHLYPLLVTAAHTGMRKSELFFLTWDDVDFDQGTITIQNKEGWHTKNYKSRVLSLTPRLRNVLLAHKQDQDAQEVYSEYVFTYKGKKLQSTIKRSLRTVLNQAGLKNVTLHMLRHTFASHLVMAGVPLREIQELMGHASFETTLQYAHLSKDHAKKQVLRLPYAE
jgi:integrase